MMRIRYKFRNPVLVMKKRLDYRSEGVKHANDEALATSIQPVNALRSAVCMAEHSNEFFCGGKSSFPSSSD